MARAPAQCGGTERASLLGPLLPPGVSADGGEGAKELPEGARQTKEKIPLGKRQEAYRREMQSGLD